MHKNIQCTICVTVNSIAKPLQDGSAYLSYDKSRIFLKGIHYAKIMHNSNSLIRASGHLIIEGCENNRYHWDFTDIAMGIFFLYKIKHSCCIYVEENQNRDLDLI